MGRIFGGSCLSDHRQFEYSDYRDGNNLYHDICSTSEDEDICRHSRCGNCSCDCRCKNSGNNDGNERKLPSAPYSCMAESGKICVNDFFPDGTGTICDRIRWLFRERIIPEVQNDMILSIICEELGVFGAIMVLILFGMLLYRLLFIAQNAPDLYGSLIVTGIFAHIALQVILNVMVVINCIPTTGITLPFISYGGTSVLFLMAEMGLALGVSARIKIAE